MSAKNYNERERILHRRAQQAESDVLRLTARNVALMEALDGLAERFCAAIQARERYRRLAVSPPVGGQPKTQGGG